MNKSEKEILEKEKEILELLSLLGDCQIYIDLTLSDNTYEIPQDLLNLGADISNRFIADEVLVKRLSEV